jgi:hypothetical protein
MASRFWVTGGTGNWNSTTNWSATSGGASGASVPGSADTATLNASSGSGTVTLDISPTIQTLTCTGFTGTLAFGTNTISLNSTGTIFTGATTMTVTGTPLIICTDSSATSRTLSSGGAVTEANSISIRITAGTGTVNLGTSSYRNLDFTDGTNPTGYAGALSSSTVTVFGDFKASTGMTVTAGTGGLSFAATSGTKTINTAGVTFDRSFTFNGVGGTWQLQSALTSGATRNCTLTNGTLDLAGYTLTTGLFTSTNSNVRTLAFGTGKIVLTATSGTIFTYGTATNLTVTGTSLVQATNGGAGTRTLTFATTGAIEANTINFEITSGSDIVSLGGTGGAAKNINFTGFTGTIDIPSTKTIYGNWNADSATSITGTSTITFAATSGTKTIKTNSLTYGGSFNFDGVGGTWSLQDALTTTGAANLTNGTLNLAGYTLTTGVFNSNVSNTRALAFGATGKIVLTATTGTVLSMSTATNFTYTGTSRIEVTASGAGRTIIPPATSAIESNAMSIYVTTGSDTLTVSGAARFLNFDLTGFAGNLTYTSFSRYFGDLVFSSGMTLGSVGSTGLFFSKTSGTQTIISAGKTIDNNVTIDGINGTVSLQDALTLGSTRTLTLTNGTLTTSGYAVTAGLFASSNANARTLNLGASTVTITGTGTPWNITDPTNMTLNAGTSTLTFNANTSTINFQGGGLTYYNVTYSGGIPITIYRSNTFNSISNTAQPITLSFEAGSTQTVNNFGFSGTAGNLVTMRSTTPGTRWNLVKNTGSTALVSYCSITDSAASPAGYWFAPISQGNINGGNNIGWNFSENNVQSNFLNFLVS